MTLLMYCNVCMLRDIFHLMEYFHISQPDKSRIDFSTLFERYQECQDEMRDYINKITSPIYLPWEKARFITPPSTLTSEEAWYIGREVRTINGDILPIRNEQERHFVWTRLAYTDHYLHDFDMHIGGHQIFVNKVRLTASENQTYLARSVIEEAIASSQLEGASVTRKDAKAMIAENRLPRDKDEWMIYNNYQMMLKITDVYKDVPMSKELLLEMHRLLTNNTMPESDIGRWRLDEDKVTLGPEMSPIITYTPPSHTFLMRELPRLIAFANDDDHRQFMHPIIKAIALHFWVGYLHPFVDGNGRIARALFYWYLLKKDYWLATYIPISTVIKRAPIQYSDAYVYSEQDNLDFTYFFDYHMRKIKTALEEFLAFVEKQKKENEMINKLLDSKARLNERQKQIMHYLTSNQQHHVSITSHSSLNNVSTQTARRDLLELQKLGLVFSLRNGKYVYYYAKPL